MNGRILLRMAFGQPRIAIPVVLVVGLTLGANAALFSVFDGLVYRPLPFVNSEAIVRLDLPLAARARLSAQERDHIEESILNTPLIQDRTEYAVGSVFDPTSPAIVDWNIRPAQVSPEMFSLVSVRPILGRALLAADTDADPRPAVLGHGLWTARFGADPGIVDRMVDIPGTRHGIRWHVVGVMPPRFDFPRGSNLWMPIPPTVTGLGVPEYARLTAGATIEQLRAAVPRVQVSSLRADYTPRGAEALGLLVLSVVMLFLVSLTQTAGLLAARTTQRHGELGMRLALGASQRRLFAEQAAEIAVLILASLVVAFLVAPLALSVIIWTLPAEMLRGQHVEPDSRTLMFVSALGLVSVALLSLVLTAVAGKQAPAALLRTQTTRGTGRSRIRLALLFGQIAISACLIYTAAVAWHSSRNLRAIDTGFNPDGLVMVRMPSVNVPAGSSRDARIAVEAAHAEKADLSLARLRALPMISAGSSSAFLPIEAEARIMVPFSPAEARERVIGEVRVTAVKSGYLQVAGQRLIEGRIPDAADIERDAASGIGTVLVTRSVASALKISGFEVVGALLETTPKRFFRVFGVVDDWANDGPHRAPVPEFIHYVRPAVATQYLLVRSAPGRLAEARAAVAGVLAGVWGPEAPREISTGEDLMRRAAAEHDSRFLLLALTAVVALPVLVAGIAGATSFDIARRRQELAVRMALGATPTQARRRVVWRAAATAFTALLLGLVAGVLIARLAESYLFGVSSVDPVSLAETSLLIVSVTVIASASASRELGRLTVTTLLQQG